MYKHLLPHKETSKNSFNNLEEEVKKLKTEIENLKDVIKEKSDKIEALGKENWQLKVENVALQKMSAELNESMLFYCDKCDFEVEYEDALETHVDLYHINPCQKCSTNFDNEDELKEHNEVYHIKSPQKNNYLYSFKVNYSYRLIWSS